MKKLFAEKLNLLSFGLGGGGAILAATLAPLETYAGLIDTHAYVQEGLVLHYDGIRNAGYDAPHSTDAAIWKNIAPAGGNDLNRYVRSGSSYTKGTSKGKWLDDGFYFDNFAMFATDASFTFPAAYTVQLLVDASSAGQQDTSKTCGYLMFPQGDWQKIAFAIRMADSNHSFYFVADRALNNGAATSARPGFSTEGFKYSYATAILSGNVATFFPGTEVPTSGYAYWDADNHIGGNGYLKGNTAIAQTVSNLRLGGGQGGTQDFTGTLKNFRVYTRALTNAELAHNRALDEMRFFGGEVPEFLGKTETTVTNAVIASVPATLRGKEPSGCYAVDAEGYTFTAPATRVDGTLTYELAGYTIEKWDGTQWGAAETKTGNSVFVDNSGKVRITWLWKAKSGLVTPANAPENDIGGYVQDGLVLHYDGIRNAGMYQPHDASATTWVNLAAPGDFDMTRYDANAVGGWWEDDGFFFTNKTYFAYRNSYTFPDYYTMQTALDVNTLDQGIGGINYIFAPHSDTWTYNALGVRRDKATEGTTVYGVLEGSLGTSDSRRPALSRTHSDYLTMIFDNLEEGINGGVLLDGTTIPAKSQRATAWPQNKWATGNVKAGATVKQIGLGAFPNNGGQYMTGKIRSFRLYNRPLTETELAQNRAVDDARFFGTLETTNVVVNSSHAFLQGTEKAGAYGVKQSWTFTAPESKTERNVQYSLAGYTLETWDKLAGWSAAVSSTDKTYTYTEGTSPEKVRLTWQWKPVKGVRSAADYEANDYVEGGLVLHYDGIRNVSSHTGHDAMPGEWRNLAPLGGWNVSRVAVTTPTGGGRAAGEWIDNGYAFHGWTYFTAKNFTHPASCTIQAVIDANSAGQSPNSYISYFWFPVGQNNSNWKKSALSVRNGYTELATHWYKDNARPQLKDTTFTYVNASVSPTRSAITAGTTFPSSGGIGAGYSSLADKASTVTNFLADSFGIGGPSDNGSQRLLGTMHSLRFYDRVLTSDEMLRNRNVDSARYFGELAVTNVLVCAKYGNGMEPACGAYTVEGTYDFIAGNATDDSGKTRVLKGYTVETLVDGKWSSPVYFDGDTYSHDNALSPAPVRLTWQYQGEGTTVILM